MSLCESYIIVRVVKLCGVVRFYGGMTSLRVGNGLESGKILRDGIALGRGVHRKMGVLIQKTRSNFGAKSGKLHKIGISGVGVV